MTHNKSSKNTYDTDGSMTYIDNYYQMRLKTHIKRLIGTHPI